MNANVTEINIEKQRQEILDAAHNRFLTYGFGKTTMAEIAEDVSMSAANLYRYFQNKQDIAAACADRCICSRNDRVREAIRQSHLTATQRLHTFAIESYRHNAEMMKDTPKINELVESVSSHSPEMIQQKMKALVALIAEILAYGNETGEFAVDDIVSTAETVYSALILFDVPIFVPLFNAEEFEEKANRVVDLIIEGIRKR